MITINDINNQNKDQEGIIDLNHADSADDVRPLTEEEIRAEKKKKRIKNLKVFFGCILAIVICGLIQYFCIYKGGEYDPSDTSGFMQSAINASIPVSGDFSSEDFEYLKEYILNKIQTDPLLTDYPHVALSDGEEKITADISLTDTATEEETIAEMEEMINMLAERFPDMKKIILYGKYIDENGFSYRAGQVEAHYGTVDEVVLETNSNN